MKTTTLAIAAVATAFAADAAELPTAKHVHAEHHKTCTIGGMTGYLIPGTETCVKVSGYIAAGAAVGDLKH